VIFVGFNPIVDTSVPVEQTVTYKDTGGATLKIAAKTWFNAAQLQSEQDTFGPVTSKTTYTYGSGDQLTERDDYDFGPGSPGGLLRKTVTAYQAFAATPTFPSSPSILDRPSSTIVYAGTSRVAESDYLYDTVGVGSVTATGHDDAAYGTSFNVRGNLTKNIQKCFVGATVCSDAVSNYAYDQTGQVLSMTDPCGNATCSDMAGTSHVTMYSYADSFTTGTPPGNTNAYLTKITDPLQHTNSFSYAYDDGQLTASTDANGQPTQYLYADSLRRLTETDYPDGGKTTLSYDDTVQTATQTRLISSSPLSQISTTTVKDGLGHVTQSQLTTDPDGTDFTDTTYDGTGHVRTVSNPHRTTSAPTDGTTSYDYDALGRTKTVTEPDGSTVLTSYTGRATDVMDEGNGNGAKRVERVSQIDGLGRVASVCEVTSSTQLGTGGTPGACGQDVAKTGFLTSYTYDVLGNLLTVTQGSLSQRSFAYDSLSRLLCAANPEIAIVVCPNPDNGSYTAGTIRNSYDANGNLATKMAPKPNQTNTAVSVTATYRYDVLNRKTGSSYNDGSTPSVANLYDQSSETGAANDVGRRTYASVSSGSTILYKRSLVTYDQMGRLQLEYQCAPDTCALDRYNIGHAYDLIGDEQTVTAGFPTAGSQTQTNLYTSAGRLQKVSTTLAQFSILDSIHYTPSGAPLSASVGPSMAESWAYNNRGQTTSIASAGPGSGGLQNFYTENLLYAPNGDVTTLNDSVNGNWLNTYDDFNRLSTAVASNVGEGCSFGYDRYGNRWQESPSSGSCNSGSLSFGTNNRIVGSSYDAAGNLLNDGMHTYTYDAENRILSVDGNTSYAYDADGRRVGKKAGGVFVAEYILDQNGRQLAQLGVGGNLVRGEVYAEGQHVATYNGQGVYFTFPDHLGTERIRRNADGSALETCTNLPFGDSQQCSGTDVSALHFTGKERDSESGLDNFGARYYGSSLGRFVTPDEPFLDQEEGDPQSWNLYSYVRNNPSRYTDPVGNLCVDGKDDNQGGETCAQVAAADATYQKENRASATVTAMPGSWLAAIGLNAFFALDNLANDFFAPIVGRPSYMQNTPTGSGVAAKTGAVAGIALSIFIGPEAKGVNVTVEGLEHVAERHMLGGALASVGKKSIFNAGEDVEGLIKAAESVRPTRMGGGDFARVVDAGRPIGIDRATGAPTSTYTVITRANGNLVNAFPGKP
jgi:RHS repeat-associated protein